MRASMLLTLMGRKKRLPFSDSFTRADGAIGNGWYGPTWTIASGAAVNTPTLGADVIVNGGFGADANWDKGGTWAIGGNVATHSASATIDVISQAVLTTGVWYRCDWTITAMSAGLFYARFGASANIGPSHDAAASYVDILRATAAMAGIRSNTAGAGSIDNVSYKSLTTTELFVTRRLGASGYVQAIWNCVTGAPAGVVMCLDNPADPKYFVMAYHNGNAYITLTKCVNGTYTDIESTSITYDPEKNLKLVRLAGTNTFQVWYGVVGNETQVGSNQTISDIGIINNVYGGLFSTSEANSCTDFSYSCGYTLANLARQGTAIAATEVFEQDNVYEPSVLLEGGTYKMWYSAGWAAPCLNYATSPDGITWTKYASNPILNGYYRSFILKDGTTYYLYAAVAGHTQIDLYTSADGITFALDTAATLPRGGAGAWDDGSVANLFVWKEGAADWRMLYEGKRAGTGWHIGYATSADGRTWAKDVANPVLAVNNTGSQGGPWVKKDGATYYLWLHRALGGTAALPTDIYRYTSPDCVTWTAAPGYPLLPRATAAEGVATAVGQLADVFVLENGATAYVYFTGGSNGGAQAGAMHIIVATGPSSIITA